MSTTLNRVDVVMPQMGVSVSEGTVARWLKSPGESIATDEPLVEISTDKVDTEVPSPASGVIAEILVGEGETVDVGTRIAVITPAAGGVVASTPSGISAGHPDTAESAEPGVRFVSPLVGRIAADHGIDVARIRGTGRGGRVTKVDILAVVNETSPSASSSPPPLPVDAVPGPAAPPAQPTVATGETGELLSPMRRSIAEHMRRSLDTSAHVTQTFEVDMSRVVAAREHLKRDAEQSRGVRLTFLAFVARAAVDALASWPWLNAEIRGDTVVTKQGVNLGIAVSLEDGKGLIVPVIKRAEGLNLIGTARAIADLAERARAKKLRAEDVQDGTFTLTTLGAYGCLHGTPIINQPQVAILEADAILKRPLVLTDEHGNDSIAIRSLMNLSLSFDHRLIDGVYAAQFMRDVKATLESWPSESA